MKGSDSPSRSPTMGRMGNATPPATPASSVPDASASASDSVERSLRGLNYVLQLRGNLGVDTAEVVLLAFGVSPLAEPFHQFAETGHPAAIPIRETLLHHPPQRRVHVPVVQQIVVDFGKDGVGVEVEALLRAVPARVAVPGHERDRYVARGPAESLLRRLERCSPSSTSSVALARAPGLSDWATATAGPRRAGISSSTAM